MKKLVLATVLALASTGILAKDLSEIRFGVDPTFAPFESKNEKGELVGFDIDLGNAICAELKVKCKWVEKSGKYKNLKVAGNAPYVVDYVSLGAKRNEYGLLNYLNLFVNQQVRNGRYDELWKKWVGDEIKPANLTVPGVYY